LNRFDTWGEPVLEQARPEQAVLRSRNAVAVVFALNGFAAANWMARIPEARDSLQINPAQLGTLLLAISIGAISALPLAGLLVHRYGGRAVITGGAVFAAFGLALAGFASAGLGAFWLTALGLLALGLGSGTWDVAMNIEAAAVEREIGRTIMPRFHAGFSFGTVLGAGTGAAASAGGLPLQLHLAMTAVIVAVGPVLVSPALPPAHETEEKSFGRAWRAWAEPRTLLVGLMVLAMALTEGTANDWLTVALVDGYDLPHWLGAVGFAVFLSAMTTGRIAGTRLLDRFGRARVLWTTMGTAGCGVLLVVFGGWPFALLGAAVWGIGASLGFPVGMSAAADDAEHAAARVSVVSTIGYTAFLAGPPLLGYLGNHVGILHALLAVVVLLVPSALAVPAAKPAGARQ
jgi:MFS family permease